MNPETQHCLLPKHASNPLIFAVIILIVVSYFVLYRISYGLTFILIHTGASPWLSHWSVTFRFALLIVLSCTVYLFILPPQISPWALTIEAALIEELIFRGIIMTLLWQRYSKWVSAILSSLLFGLCHFTAGVTYMVQAFVGALIVFSVLRLQTKNIWTGVCAHFLMLRGLTSSTWSGFFLLEFLLALYVLARKWWMRKTSK